MKILAFVLMCFASVASANDRLQAILNGFESMSATFQQATKNDDGFYENIINGTVKIQRPNHLRMDYQFPTEQTLIADGIRLWVRDHDLEQTSVYNQEEVLKGSPISLLLEPSKLTENFTVSQIADNEFQLTPKTADTLYESIMLILDAEKVVQAVVRDSVMGQTIEVSFDYESYNQPLSDTAFSVVF